jgi:hypothetical protein
MANTLYADKKPTKSFSLWPVIILLILIIACLLGLWAFLVPKPNRNALAIGQDAKVEEVNLFIQSPTELDFLSKAEIYQIRTAAVEQYPELMARDYDPSDSVFGQIVDGLPWWGMEGMYFYGGGEKSITGPSEEARFLLNPYLLVAADFYDNWNGRISEAELSKFALTCTPYELRWWPRQARAEAAYYAACVKRGGNYSFDLISYNARDWNLNYVYVSYQDSVNISHPNIPTAAYEIPHYIHQGSSCGYPGGCNNMSPYTPEIDGLRITALPAMVVVWLWEEQPTSLEDTPDMIFVIHFQ